MNEVCCRYWYRVGSDQPLTDWIDDVGGCVHPIGIPVYAVPGASSLTAALSVSGLRADRFVFEGFLPKYAQQRLKTLETLKYVGERQPALSQSQSLCACAATNVSPEPTTTMWNRSYDRTIVFFESPKRITKTLEDCVAVFGPNHYAVVARELTKLYETVCYYQQPTNQ
jgi:16S rRNA (cytidine1402-2'-O)-methyltransferase